MPLMNRPLPVDDPNRIFELKYNGFRALAVVERVPTQLYVGGRWRDASGGGTLAVEDPATADTLVEVGRT